MWPAQCRSDLGLRLSPTPTPVDPAEFIRTNLRLEPAPGIPGILLYTAHPGSGLRRLEELHGAAPYWAYLWSGGAVLARYIAEHPEAVAGRHVLDLGSGSGVIAIAAAQAGAATVLATDIDSYALAATALNAEANGVAVRTLPGIEPLPAIDLVLAGDVFYDARTARRSIAQLDAIRAAGIDILVGDPGRKHLPLKLLARLAEYEVAEFGASRLPGTRAAVYAYRP